jgi:hypothetical protein
MIVLCGTVAATQLMSYRDAYRAPLALLYQLQHFAYVHNGLRCSWSINEPLAKPIGDSISEALQQWRQTVDIVAGEEPRCPQ